MLKNFKEAQDYIYSYITERPNPFVGGEGLKRTVHFLDLLGNPQEAYKVIHIAGTSGKGSTAFYTSKLFHALGFRTGLHLSPHLIDLRERFMINNAFIPEEKFVSYLNSIIPFAQQMEKTEFGKLSYFELLVSLAFYVYREEKVDYAVVETGMGGWYDGTNTVQSASKTAVITAIGLDHTEILGKTEEEITLHKAKIIKTGNTVVAHANTPSVRAVIEGEAQEQHAGIVWVRPGETVSDVRTTEEGILFNYRQGSRELTDISIPTHARYQAENAGIALSVLYALADRDGFAVDEATVRNALKGTGFKGRMEEFEKDGKRIILDGAHNPQKMEAFLDSLVKAYSDKSFHFLVAFKKRKDYKSMLSLIGKVAKSITFTGFYLDTQDSRHLSEIPDELLAESVADGYKNTCAITDPVDAFNGLLNNMKNEDIAVVTGSLYLLSCLYPRIRP